MLNEKQLTLVNDSKDKWQWKETDMQEILHKHN